VRYFFNLVLGTQRLTDPDGAEYSSFAEAQAEADQVARDTAAEELRHGRPIPPDWRIEITDGFGNVHSNAPFEGIVLSGRAGTPGVSPHADKPPGGPRAPRGALSAPQGQQQPRPSTQEVDALAARIRATFQEMRDNLAALK
jgi:hypothetical protein